MTRRLPHLLWAGFAALLTAAPSADAQRRARAGPILSTIAIDDAGGVSHSHRAFGVTAALLAGDDGETGLTIARYADLSDNTCTRELTLYALESNYYPVGPGGIAPFASTTIGLARVTDEDVGLLGLCAAAEPTSEVALGFGLGVRVNLGTSVAGIIEGRFLQIPHSAIQALEGRANLSVAFGKPRRSQLLRGAVGPAVGVLVPVGGSFEGRGPTLGARFRRNTPKAGVLALHVDYAPLRITAGCTAQCEPSAILFAPGYEASVYPLWGRLYGTVGFLLTGFPSEGPDRGIAQGAHGGVGADLVGGTGFMWNVSARVLWVQRNNRENVFLLQAAASLSRRLERPAPIESR